MPIYQYKCSECDHEFEAFHKISEREVPKSKPCPSCNVEGHVMQILTKVGFTDSFRLGRIKPDDNTREMLNIIDKANPNNTMKLNW